MGQAAQAIRDIASVKTRALMGILNVTPDSFSDGGVHSSPCEALAAAQEMLAAGACIIDIGGESSRPGADPVSTEEELRRVIPVISKLQEEFGRNVSLSIDTYHPEVAEAACRAGAHIINDISGFRDPKMLKVAQRTGAACVLMHMAGEPRTMQDKPFYIDVVQEVGDYLIEGAQRLEKAGILPQRIILDPGFGFGKTKEHNLELFLHMDLLVKRIHAAGYRVLVGVSRKSFIGAVFGIEDPKDRDEASAQLAAALLAAGVDIVRVHNVAMTGAAIDDLSAVDSKSAYLALGSNLGATMSNLARALHLVDRLPLTNLEEIATPVLSEPAYDSNQSPFVNTVCRLKTNLAARALFTYLQAIELEMGREKLRVNGPRVIDLDLLSYDEESIDLPGLKLPHPRMSERAFVLEPLQELCPEGFVLPDGTKLEAAAEVYGQITTRLPLELLRSEIQQRREKESRRVKREESQQQIQVKAEDWSSWKGSL